MKGKKTTILMATLLIATIATVFGAYLLHSLLSIPSDVDVVETPYKLLLYTDEACTTLASEIPFPDMTDSLTQGIQVNSSAYYLRPELDEITIYTSWNYSDAFDTGNFSLIGYEYSESNSKFNIWTMNTQYLETSDVSIRRVMFGLVKNDSPPLGNYAFEIQFLAHEQTT